MTTATFPDPTIHTEALPVEFIPPLAEPLTGALYAVTDFSDPDEVPRWLASGVDVRARNYGLAGSVGVWAAPWCGDPGSELKSGTRPASLGPFDPITVWGYDECDPTPASRAEVHARAEHNLATLEPVAVEREFAARLLADATVVDRAGVQAAIGYLEGKAAQSNTRVLLHCSPAHLPFLTDSGLVTADGPQLRTPLGNTWVFGGGYVDGLARTIVATSPTYGWRTDVEVRDAVEPQTGTAISIAERSVVIGYEAAIAATRLV